MLAETERLGRQALSEVRRLVDLLREDESASEPLPGAADLHALVGRLREAGMDVRLQTEGDVDRLSDSAGLTLTASPRRRCPTRRATRPGPRSGSAWRSASARRGCGCGTGARAGPRSAAEATTAATA
jgi:hypothetical protein